MRLRLIGSLIIWAVSFSFLAAKAHANCFDCCSQYSILSTPPNVWYAGVAYTQGFVQPHQEWRRFFFSHVPGTGFYFGRVICDWFSLELGYEWNIDKLKSFVIQPGETVLGVTNYNFPITQDTPGVIGRIPPVGAPPPGPITIRSKLRFKSGYLDINNFIPVFFGDYCFNLLTKTNIILSIGVANTRPKFHIRLEPTNLYPISELGFLQAKSKAILRLGAGIQGYFYKNFGLRLMVRWYMTNAIRGRDWISALPRNRYIVGNTWLAYVGVYFAFPDPLENY